MNYEISRDISAVRFVRCLRRLPGRDAFAVGAGFSINQATVRCQSEWLERRFEIEELRPSGITPDGIAAHPARMAATENAYHEAIEGFVVDQIAATNRFAGLPILNLGHLQWWVARTTTGYFSIIRTMISGVPFVAHSGGPSLIKVLLKTWEEYRNPLSLKPSTVDLARYSKLALKVGADALPSVKFTYSVKRIECPNLNDFDVQYVRRGNHYVVYLMKRIGEPKP